MAYRLFIFDFDGTLADSFPFFIQVFNQLADEYGFGRIDPAQAGAYRHFTPRQMMHKVAMPAWKLPIVGKRFIGLMHAAPCAGGGICHGCIDCQGCGAHCRACKSLNSCQAFKSVLNQSTGDAVRRGKQLGQPCSAGGNRGTSLSPGLRRARDRRGLAWRMHTYSGAVKRLLWRADGAV